MQHRSVTAVALSLALLFAACDDSGPALGPEEIVEAFVELNQAPDRTVHIDLRGTFRWGAGEGMSFESVIDCAGDDCAAGSQLTGGGLGPSMRIDVVVAGGQAFMRMPDSGWERSFDSVHSLDPLRGLGLTDLEYVGVEDSEIGPLHELRISNTTTLLNNGPGVAVGPVFRGADDSSRVSAELFVDGRGRPVVLTMAMEVGQLDFGMQMRSHYEYSGWGAEIEILPPF